MMKNDMMNNKRYSKLCFLVLFAWGISLAGCNKAYTPPDLTGTWGKPDFYFYIVPQPNIDIGDYALQEAVTIKINTKLESKDFWHEFVPLLEFDEDYPETLSINVDNTYRFIYYSGLIQIGTYKQDGHILAFSDSASPPNVVYGEADGTLLWLHLFNKTQEPKEPFYYAVMGIFNLNEEEQVAYELMIAGYHIGVGYSRTY